jgi:hypothetical protein
MASHEFIPGLPLVWWNSSHEWQTRGWTHCWPFKSCLLRWVLFRISMLPHVARHRNSASIPQDLNGQPCVHPRSMFLSAKLPSRDASWCQMVRWRITNILKCNECNTALILKMLSRPCFRKIGGSLYQNQDDDDNPDVYGRCPCPFVGQVETCNTLSKSIRKQSSGKIGFWPIRMMTVPLFWSTATVILKTLLSALWVLVSRFISGFWTSNSWNPRDALKRPLGASLKIYIRLLDEQ